MRISIATVSLLLSILLGTLSSANGQETQLTEERFRELHRELQPTGLETWRSIPWMTTVLSAQRAAALEDKPIFIWSMDGHPLGCT